MFLLYLKVILHTDEEGVFNGFKGRYTFDENDSINRGESLLDSNPWWRTHTHTHTKHFFSFLSFGSRPSIYTRLDRLFLAVASFSTFFFFFFFYLKKYTQTAAVI